MNRNTRIPEYLTNKIKDRNLTELIHKHIENLKRSNGNKRIKKNEIYFSVMKKTPNFIRDPKEYIIKSPKRKAFDRKILESHSEIPNNCLHIKASFIIWRTKK